MIWLVLGVALWWAAHLFKRIAPGLRDPMGEAGKGLVSVLVLGALVLMVIGYRQAEGAFFWGRNSALVGINNLLMLLAFYCFGASAAKGAKVWLGTKLRHPQLTGFSIWAASHLLVNGDVPSFILFGGLLAWALVEIAVINRAEGPWTPPPQAPAKKEITLVVVTVVLFALTSAVHYWLGYPVFG
ncbi:MAG: NnrU family protein [Rhodobacter sp.]|nr:NnrU family protein [Rhodobacter sp.]